MTQQTIATEGDRPHTVRVFAETTRKGTAVLRIEWREHGKRQRITRPDTKAERTWAKAEAKVIQARLVLGERQSAAPKRVSMGQAVAAYMAHNTHWRPKTRDGIDAKLSVWLAFTTKERAVRDVSQELVDDFRKALRETPREKTGKPMAASQISRHVNAVKGLLRFARARKYIGENPLADYVVKLGKEEQPLEVPEYTNEEWAALLGALSPRKAREWRAYCLVALAGILGPRQTAARSLEWRDLDLTARTVTWRKELDKVGKERVQPLPRDAVRLFRIARVWARRDGYTGALVFYGAQARSRHKPYTEQALLQALVSAEVRAHVAHVPYRGMHGLRRTAAGNALEATNNLKTAGDWIGDSDLKSLQRYLKRRPAHLERLAALTQQPKTTTPRPTGQGAAKTRSRR